MTDFTKLDGTKEESLRDYSEHGMRLLNESISYMAKAGLSINFVDHMLETARTLYEIEFKKYWPGNEDE